MNVIRFRHMSWLDEKIGERDALRNREVLLDNHASTLYGELWDEIIKIVVEAKGNGLPVNTGGSTHKRTIRAAYENDVKEILLSLSQDDRSIEITGDISIKFSISICGDGVVCLQRHGKGVSLQEAAHQILGPLLFPELYKANRPVTTPSA